MGKINLLSPSVANLIAAGEVVDRPASAVKELLENAIDSGAHTITVEIQRGGISFIRVADDGCGIEKEDLAPAITRHSTSKISTASDLDSIFTLGFRGEALAAIASVSRLRIFSKIRGAEMGALLEADGGRILSITDTGCREGTTIIVEELFHNVPARRKFLKKDATEGIAISAVVEKIALSRPDIAFKYISDGEIKFFTTGKGDLNETIWALFGRDLARRSLKVEREEDGIRITGYVSEPDLFRSNRNMENFFINGRYIKSKTASAALEQAYSSKIPQDKFPFCVLNIALNPAAVDVNVHPAKLEVKFTNEKLIFDAVYYAALSALEASAKRPELQLGSSPVRNSAKSAASSSSVRPDYANAFLPADSRVKKSEQLRMANIVEDLQQKHVPNKNTPGRSLYGKSSAFNASVKTSTAPVSAAKAVSQKKSYESISDMFPPEEALSVEELQHANREVYENIKRASAYVPRTLAAVEKSSQENNEPVSQTPEVMSPVEYNKLPVSFETSSDADEIALPSVIEIRENDIPEYYILGEAFNCYVIVQVADRLLMIDKHAAHERILFDELCRKMHAAVFGGKCCGQLLLTSYDVELLASEVDAMNEYGTQLHALGFDYSFEKIGVSTYKAKITQIPEDLDAAAAAELFTTLTNGLSDMSASVESTAGKFFESRLWQASCKAAIKGGRVYDVAHIKWICDRLLKKPGEDNQVIRVCPHGRPVAFEIKKSSIDRQFARIT